MNLIEMKNLAREALENSEENDFPWRHLPSREVAVDLVWKCSDFENFSEDEVPALTKVIDELKLEV